MNYSADAIALLERLLDLASHLLDDAGIVASYSRPGVGEPKVDVLPVRGVDADGIDLYKDVIVPQLGLRNVPDLDFALLDEHDGLGSHVCGVRLIRCRNGE